MNPGLVCAPASADLGDNHEAIRIGMERPLNKLIGHMRTVEVAGINMVHARLYGLAQNSYGSVNISGWSPHPWTRKLHCTVPHAVHGHGCARQREAAGEIS